MGAAMNPALQTRAMKRTIDGLIVAVMVVLALGMLLPFLWLFATSFRMPSEAYKLPPSFLPPNLDLSNYAAVFASRVPFIQIYMNSLLIAAVVTVGQLVTCTLAAFAFARLNFRGRDTLFFILLVGLMFPAQVTILPIYLGYARVGLINQPIGLALMYLTSSFGVFLMRQFMLSQPKALEEAALMDGASRLRTLGEVVVPLAWPGVATTAILTFLYSWNEFLFALSFTLGPERQTVPVAITLFRGQYQIAWGQVLAGAIVATLPVALLVLVAQRRIVQGLTAGAVKG
jgi:multiple sugar transport system permease protein